MGLVLMYGSSGRRVASGWIVLHSFNSFFFFFLEMVIGLDGLGMSLEIHLQRPKAKGQMMFRPASLSPSPVVTRQELGAVRS